MLPFIRLSCMTLVAAACALWANAGVVCVERSDHPVWVRVSKIADGCYARVGMGTSGPQVVNLESPGCWTQGTIAHELGHALGLIHEHQRPDRDTYVTINFSNIEADKTSNFTTYVTARMWTPYDFGSLMHYGKYAFATDVAVATITPKPEYAAQAQNMGQRARPSEQDQATMVGLYNLPPRIFRSYGLTPRRLTIGRVEALAAMATINSYYLAPQGMARSNGLSIDGKPDFLGIAAWVVDIYMGQRLVGVSPDAAWQRVVFEIQQTDEWKTKHP